METINQPTHPTDYRLAKLMDGSLLMGTISVDDEHMRIINPLELVTIPRMTNEGLKEDTTLSKWIPFTDDELILLPLDRVVTMTSVKSDLLSYYIKLSEKHKLTEHSTFAEAELEEGYEDDDEDYLSKLESASNSTIH